MPELVPGDVFHDPDFTFQDRQTGNKLFVLLGVSRGGVCVVARTTSNPSSKSRGYGCHNGRPLSELFHPARSRLVPRRHLDQSGLSDGVRRGRRGTAACRRTHPPSVMLGAGRASVYPSRSEHKRGGAWRRRKTLEMPVNPNGRWYSTPTTTRNGQTTRP